MKYDCIIVGGGASGLMAAISSLKSGKSVLLLERNEKCGKKIYITGKGRCNVTSDRDISEFFDFIVRNETFMYSAFYTFDNRALISMLNENGLETKVERGNRVFPVTDRASDVTKTLLKIINKSGNCDIRYNTKVTDLIVEDGETCGVVAGGRKYHADNVVLCMGGKTYPSTGSDGSGYAILRRAGHTVTPLSPALVQLYSDEEWIHELSGLTMKNAEATLVLDGKKKESRFGEILFTHQGLSGPVMLYLSNFINPERRNDYSVKIDLKPALDVKTLDARLVRDFQKNANRTAEKSLDLLLPKSLARALFSKSGIDPKKKINLITKKERRILLDLLKDLEVRLTGPGGFREAIITSGGVDPKEINPSTMESRKVSHLFITGETIDVHALTGGFNLQIAFSTGWLAGQNLY